MLDYSINLGLSKTSFASSFNASENPKISVWSVGKIWVVTTHDNYVANISVIMIDTMSSRTEKSPVDPKPSSADPRGPCSGQNE